VALPSEDSLADLRLRDYAPEQVLRLPEHLPTRAAFPAVDIHNHLGRWHSESWSAPNVGDLLSVMDDSNVATIVNLDGCWADRLEENLSRYDRRHPDRFLTFCRLDWADCATAGWGSRLAASLRDSVGRGAGGLKVWKDVGLQVRDESGDLLFLDDLRLEPVWEVAAATLTPILIHTADPAAFFRPPDAQNERLEQLLNHPDWQFHGPEYPKLDRLLEALETLVASHPEVTFIAAHVGCYAEDLSWVDRMLASYPNFNIDIAARVPDLGRQPRAARRLLLKHPRRALLGTDSFPPSARAYALYYRFLETDDECFPYSHKTPPDSGRWTISGLHLPPDVLEQVLAGNARRLIPRLANN